METGPDFREEHVLKDGTRVTFRHIRPEDAAELRREFARLSPESRYRRFFGAAAVLDDATVDYLTHVDGRAHVAIIATTESLDLKSERGIGVVRFVRIAEDPKTAEIAITVVDDMQEKGLGTLLADAAVRAARERGIERFVGEVLEVNAHLVASLREHPAITTKTENGVLSFEVDLREHRDLSELVRRILALASSPIFLALRWLRR